jgi:hypothetical protein
MKIEVIGAEDIGGMLNLGIERNRFTASNFMMDLIQAISLGKGASDDGHDVEF